jgi:hypothetical protein
MKFKTVLLMGALLALLSMVACTMRSHTEPEITVNNALNLGVAIFVNQTTERRVGVNEIHINEGDTVKVHLTSALLKAPSYQWNAATAGVVKFVKDDADPTLFYAIAVGDSGATSQVDLNDVGNGALRSVDVYIEKQWADPFYYTFIGSYEGHSYYLSTIIRGWVEAEILCREAGGYMVAINTAEENVFLNEARGAVDNVWIGIRLNPSGNSFKITTWANGEEVEYRALNSTSAGIFSEFYYFMDSNGKWENWHEISYPYFLEME